MFNRKFVLGIFALLLSSTAWSAPTLTVGKASGNAGTEVVLPITFASGGAKVSAAEFSLILPKDLSGASVALGGTGTSAGKLISAKQVGEHWNIIIMGMNQNPIDSGVLAQATVKISPKATAGRRPIAIERVVYSDGAGKSVSGGRSKGGEVLINPL